MNQKRNANIILVLIVIISIIILALLAGYMYIVTDLFKSEKDVFLKYTAQIVSGKSGLLNNSEQQYLEKKKISQYKNASEINISMKPEEMEFNISFFGETDKQNLKAQQEIMVDILGIYEIPIKYKRIGEIFGIQMESIGSNFVAVEANELDELPNNIFSELQILMNLVKNNKEVKNNIQNIIIQELDDSYFSKTENGSGYKLTITVGKTKEIINKTLEAINEEMDSSNDIIDSLLEMVEQDKTNKDDTIEIVLYKNRNKIEKISMTSKTNKIIIEKSDTGMKVAVESLGKTPGQVNITVEYNDTETDTVNESYVLEIVKEDATSIIIQLKNIVNFENIEEIEEFTKDNSVILTDYPKETVSKFLEVAAEKLTKELLQGLLIENTSFINDITNSDEEEVEVNQSEVVSYNEQFQIYESNKASAQTVRGLMSIIKNSNEQSENYKIEEMNLNGEEYEITEENIEELKDKIEMEMNYRVEFEMDEVTGAIYRAVINEVATDEERETE